ncbi:MAG: hypothetical protein ACXWU1_01100 [Allosphingosinicella sp.]
MAKSATDVMQEIIFAAVVDSLGAMKDASRGVPNTLLRDIGTIHANATFADLPKEVQSAISANVRAAFNRLLKEGYAVSPAGAEPRPAAPRHVPSGPRGRPGHGGAPRGPGRPNAPGGKPGGGGRPSGGKPGGGGARPSGGKPGGGGRPAGSGPGGKPRGR